MEFKRMTCPNCGASIKYTNNQSEVFCEYCGSNYPTGIVQKNAEQDGYDFEKGRQRAMVEQRLLYNHPIQQPTQKKKNTWLWVLGWIFCFPIPLTILIWKSNKMNTKLKTGLTIGLWVFMFIIGFTDNKTNNNSSGIQLGFSGYELKDNYYSDVETRFRSLGFSNIETEIIQSDDQINQGKVDSVSINGKTNFMSYERYSNDSKIIIRYYSNSEERKEAETASEEINQEYTKTVIEEEQNNTKSESEIKEKKEGFDKEKNNEFEIFGYIFSVPSYYGNMDSKSKENTKYFYANTNDSKVMLYIAREDLDVREDIFLAGQGNYIASLTDGLVKEDTFVIDKDIKICDCHGKRFEYDGIVNDVGYHSIYYFYYDVAQKSLIHISLAQSDYCKYDYSDDFEKIIENIEKGDETKSEETKALVNVDATEITTEATTETTTEAITEAAVQEKTYHYVLNTNTKKFHYSDCSSVKKMKDKNKEEIDCTRQHLIDMGYSPCGNCHP